MADVIFTEDDNIEQIQAKAYKAVMQRVYGQPSVPEGTETEIASQEPEEDA